MLTRKSLFGVVSEEPTELGMRLAAAAREEPLYFDEGLGMPVLLRGSDVQTVLRDPETFSTRVYANGLMRGALISTHGGEHTRKRRLYNSFFAPQQIRQYEERIVAPAVARVLDRLEDEAQPDLVDHFCMEVPKLVVSALFGLPADRIAQNDVLVRTTLRALVRPYDEQAVAEGERAYAAMADELWQIAARELERPSETLLGEIAKALIAEGSGTVEACERIVFTLILASYETTIWGLASVMAGLLRYPEAMSCVRADPQRVPGAIEEAWRWCGNTAGTVRFVEREVTIADKTLPAGGVIYAGFLAQHYDADVYDRPEVFDIDRKAKTMIFGGGIHFCAGAPLARMETRVAVNQLLARFPGLRADVDRPRPVFSLGTRGSVAFGPDHLPVVLR